jgi:hypothetical protein
MVIHFFLGILLLLWKEHSNTDFVKSRLCTSHLPNHTIFFGWQLAFSCILQPTEVIQKPQIGSLGVYGLSWPKRIDMNECPYGKMMKTGNQDETC